MEQSEEAGQSPAGQRWREVLRTRPQGWQRGIPEVEPCEREGPEHGRALERDGLAQAVARYAGAVERLAVAGVSSQPGLRSAEP